MMEAGVIEVGVYHVSEGTLLRRIGGNGKNSSVFPLVIEVQGQRDQALEYQKLNAAIEGLSVSLHP